MTVIGVCVDMADFQRTLYFLIFMQVAALHHSPFNLVKPTSPVVFIKRRNRKWYSETCFHFNI